MYVLYEEEGDLKAGTVRGEAPASLQVDSTSGKRVKVKSAAVLLRFEQPAAEALLSAARAAAGTMDVDFLWQCAPEEEFGFGDLAVDYCGRAPGAVEAAAILMRLQSAPIHFQRRGKGRFRRVAAETVRLALVAVERRRQQEETRADLTRELCAGRLPPALAGRGIDLMVSPDRSAIEYKALEQAAIEMQTTPLRVLLACGAIASPYAWHRDAFLAQHFPAGPGFASDLPAPPAHAAALPAAGVRAFSIDDSATTEIDDAFSVRSVAGGIEVGIHIAAPALAIADGDALDQVARARLSTVYAPGLKYTMLPPAWADSCSLVEGRTAPALSLYLLLDPQTLEPRAARTALDAVDVESNLRYDLIEDRIDVAALESGQAPVPFAAELGLLWRFSGLLRARREAVRGRPEPAGRVELAIRLEGEDERARVGITARRRDAPLDRIVAELMIHANSHWGAWLESLGHVAIYRSQALGRVRMSTTPAPHDGLGVARYAWCTSPLRRYVDLVNQRQILAAVRGAAPPYRRGDAGLFAAVSAFDAAYGAYAEFQERMEAYWSLRWLGQEGRRRIEGHVARGDAVRLRGLPMVTRVAGAAEFERGQWLELELTELDLVGLSPNARILRPIEAPRDAPSDAVADDEGALDGPPPAPAGGAAL